LPPTAAGAQCTGHQERLLVGSERSGRALAEFLQKKISKFCPKKFRSQKAIVLIFAKKIFRFREFGSCRLEFRARDPTIPEFSKTESDPTSTASARVRRLDCPGECLLVMAKLAYGSTEANASVSRYRGRE